MKTRNKYALILVSLLVVILLSACATPNPLVGTPVEETGRVNGFGDGIIDGFTIIFGFLGSLTGENLGLYEVHNNGIRYDAGFMLGLFVLFLIISFMLNN